MRHWSRFPNSAKIKTIGYAISVVSVILLAIVSWKNAASNPLLALCLFGGASTSIGGMALRWWSYEIEEAEKKDK
jgi:nicotinamide riboside transporter PnuC